MARQEEDKEDLIRDATALVRRAELQLPEKTFLITAGFRKDGSLSLYFDQDPFLQFTGDGLLRRAYADGFLYRSEGSTLSRMHRERSADQTKLVRTDLSPEELSDFTSRQFRHVRELLAALHHDAARILRCVPTDDDLRPELRSFLECIVESGIRPAPPISPR